MNLEQRVKDSIRTVENFPNAGISYKDISTFFLQPALVSEVILDGAHRLSVYQPDAIAGVESRGFILGLPLAVALNVPFVMVRKAGKLPAETFMESYQLEYGSAAIELHKDSLMPDMRVIVCDDVLATGGTATATHRLIQKTGAKTIACFFLLELAFLHGRKMLENEGINVESMAIYK